MVENWGKDKKYYDHLCGCGCEGRIEVKPHHKYMGIPRYLNGHWAKSAKGKEKLIEVHSGKIISQEMRDNLRDKLTKPKESRICLECGSVVEVTVGSERGTFCSHSCSTKYYWRIKDNLERCKRISKARNKQVEIVCRYCGKKYKVHPYRAEIAIYCSRDCFGKAHSGENASAWNGGTQHFPYHFAFNEEFKTEIRERDNNTCQLCGKTKEQGGKNLCVHHINYDKMNDCSSENDFTTLCNSCNDKVNGNRNYWTEFFGLKLKLKVA